MDVSAQQFPNQLVKIIQLIAGSHFVSLDLEFTGIPSRRGQGKLSLQDIYDDLRHAAQKYQILQVGLTIVEEDPQNGGYVARPYNFHINPVPLKERYLKLERIWSYQSAAVAFLLENKFRFDLPFSVGVPYLSREEEEQIRESWIVRDVENSRKQFLDDMTEKSADKPLIDHIHQAVKKWLNTPDAKRDDYVNIPSHRVERSKEIPASLNRYQMRLTHQTIRNHYKDLAHLGKAGFIQVRQRDLKEETEDKKRKEGYRERDLIEAIEFRWLIEALGGGDISKLPRAYFLAAIGGDPKTIDEAVYHAFVNDLQSKLKSRSRILVGHNLFIDLIYLYQSFIGTLPGDVEVFQQKINHLFPGIIDTKYLASQITELRFETSLETLGKAVKTQRFPAVDVPPDFMRYEWEDSFHEAGFDSLQTAKVCIKLAGRLSVEEYFKRPAKATEDLDAESEAEFVQALESPSTDPTIEGLAFQMSTLLLSPLPSPASNSQPSRDAEVVAVRMPSPKPHSQSSVEVKRITNMKFGSKAENIFNLLDCDEAPLAGPEERVGEEKTIAEMIFDGGNEEDEAEAGQVEKSRTPVSRARGEMMPGWDEMEFWKTVGGRLSVGGSIEGVFNL